MAAASRPEAVLVCANAQSAHRGARRASRVRDFIIIPDVPILPQGGDGTLKWFMNRFAISALAALCLAPAYGQKPDEYWPGTTYDSKLPTVRQVLGYEPGDKVTSHAGLLKYMEALSAAAPA